VSAVYGLAWSIGLGHPFMPAGYTAATVPLEFLTQFGIASVFALCEQIGFRGYLLQRLMPLGTSRALVVSGLLFALWHFPLMWLTPVYPILGSWLIVGPIVLVTLTAAGVFFGYLRLSSGSVLPPTLAHGMVNTCFNMFKAFTVASTPLALEYLAGETGALTLVCSVLAASWLAYRLVQRRGTLAGQMQAST
jgi:membrane protease YdiL (CAAX protease family)